MNYEKLDWASLDYFKTYLHQRVTEALFAVRDHLSTDDTTSPSKQTKLRHQNAEIINLWMAWANLINHKDAGALDSLTYQLLSREDLPDWFVEFLSQKTRLRIEFQNQVRVQLETFLEGILLLYRVAAHFSHVDSLQIMDVSKDPAGIVLRIVFVNPDGSAPFTSLADLTAQMQGKAQQDPHILLEFLAAQDMLNLNHARFRLQHNQKTGQQAFSAHWVSVPSPDSDQPSKPEDTASKATMVTGSASTIPKPRVIKKPEPAETGESEDTIIVRPKVPEGGESHDTPPQDSASKRESFSW